ncbi:MAG: hypothetical protein ACK2T4_03005 [Candidatus Promineifilaceae bacterium]|jgi:DNA-directed RNA polymerase subunit RPC12/RpoP
MRTALSEKGETIVAGSGMPEEAFCPYCGGRVILRKRRLMGGGVTYYWRHVDYKQSKSCSKRAKPYKRYI